MAPAGKFSHPASAMAVSVVLILLSEVASERQCSWCGPLAEQVHRSQRAPPCHQPGVTTCDPGLEHCAIVASSPPYVESRLCVKYYQDECYSIFCNSSRTWRMTCPCRGDLCNVEKTEREDEAFAFLARLGSKIQNLRIKKRTVSHARFISQSTNKTIVNNEEYSESNTSDGVDKNLQTDKVDNMTDISNNDVSSDTEMKDSDDNMTPGVMNDSNSNITTDTSSIKTSDDINDKNENEIEATSPPNIVITSERAADTDISTSTPRIDLIVQPAELTTIEPLRKDIKMDIQNHIAAEISVTEKSIEKILIKSDIKPSMEMPTAEALQQNSSPSAFTQKTQLITEQTTETTVMMTTAKENIHVTVTPEPMKLKKNNAVRISLHYLITLFWILFFM